MKHFNTNNSSLGVADKIVRISLVHRSTTKVHSKYTLLLDLADLFKQVFFLSFNNRALYFILINKYRRDCTIRKSGIPEIIHGGVE